MRPKINSDKRFNRVTLLEKVIIDGVESYKFHIDGKEICVTTFEGPLPNSTTNSPRPLRPLIILEHIQNLKQKTKAIFILPVLLLPLYASNF